MEWTKRISDTPGQILITAGQIQWTMECENSLKMMEAGTGKSKNGLKVCRRKWIKLLEAYAELVRSPTLHTCTGASPGIAGRLCVREYNPTCPCAGACLRCPLSVAAAHEGAMAFTQQTWCQAGRQALVRAAHICWQVCRAE